MNLPNGFNLIGVTVPGFPGNESIKQVCKLYNNSQIIDFYTMDMEELSVIAKYRILPVPTLLILSNGKVLGRIVKDIPNVNKLQQLIARLVKA
jgi:hypothetical protein